jgi:hypothetical protein
MSVSLSNSLDRKVCRLSERELFGENVSVVTDGDGTFYFTPLYGLE